MERGKWHRAILCLPVFLALTAICFGQKPGNSKQKKPAEIHVFSRLVNLSVVVRDKHGNPVTDLSQKDFTILDNGHPQTVAFFRAPNTGKANNQPKSLPPNVYSNVGAGGSSSGLTIILLDNLNTGFLTQAKARATVIHFLLQVQPKDRVALYVLGHRLEVIQDFTGDTETLIAALKQYKQNLGYKSYQPYQMDPVPVGGSAAAAEQALNAAIGQANEVTADFARDNRFDLTLQAINEIAKHVAGVPGRKNLIWVAGDLPYCLCANDQEIVPNYYRQVRDTEHLLSSANVAVYPVDARGLVGQSLGLVNFEGMSGPVLPSAHAPPPHYAMDEAAKSTGGVAFFNSNDIQGAIQRAATDADSSYTLSYYPDHGNWKGEFRKIKVKVDRAGLQVRARSGYYATPSAPEQKATLVELAMSPEDSTEIPIMVKVSPKASKGGPQVGLMVQFDPHSIQFTREGGRVVAHLQVGVFQKDAEGKIVGANQEALRVAASEAEHEKEMKAGMGLSFDIPLLSKASTVVLVLRDATTGVSGSLLIPILKYEAAATH